VGQITSRVTHDINAITSFISDGAINLFADLIIVVGIIILMAVIHWQLTLVTLLSLPIAVLSMRYIGKKMRQAYWDVQQALAEVNTGVEQGIAGIRVAKSLSRESFTMEKFEQLSYQNMKANLKTAMLFAAVFPTMTITNMLGIALVLGYGGSLIATGQMTIGTLMAFFAYVYRLFGPLRELGLVYGTIQSAGASLDRVLEVMEKDKSLPEPELPQRPASGFEGLLSVKHVNFSYADEPTLKDIHFDVKAGSSLAIVGPTGAGKSTLAKIIARLYDPDQGQIEIDGINLRQIATSHLRQIVTIVPQDVFLFSDSILNNIRYGKPEADKEEIFRVAKKAQAHQFIKKLPNGYQSQVGELGTKLSGGQKQLIAFARALLSDPKILILDEATANVDPLTESLIQKAMSEISKNRTTLIIAHRFSTLSQVEKILVLDNGQMEGLGTHKELIENNEIYQKLYQQGFQNR
jgi:ABC-type multidrug transport system fused ATPase/permease subunit